MAMATMTAVVRKTETASTHLNMNIGEDKDEGEAGVGRVYHLCQHRLHSHVLLTSPSGGVREGSAESAHADEDHNECSTAKG
jgi:hypothetical protein